MSDPTSELAPILCAPLLREVDQKLIELLRSLSPGEWELQTVAPQWRVRDVAAHLLDTALRKLSLARDSCFVETVSIPTPRDLVELIDRLNREGVAVYRRLSPQVLISMMEVACAQSADYHESLDPFAPALFPVTWAGDLSSPNWFDTARELTERWHHQQQIRLATNRPGIMTRELHHPVLDCFLRALPHLYRQVAAAEGTVVAVEITGDCGGEWLLTRGPHEWSLVSHSEACPDARVTIPQELAWRLFTRGIAKAEARSQIQFEGDTSLGEKILDLTAIVG